jgi:hypothetical protein
MGAPGLDSETLDFTLHGKYQRLSANFGKRSEFATDAAEDENERRKEFFV